LCYARSGWFLTRAALLSIISTELIDFPSESASIGGAEGSRTPVPTTDLIWYIHQIFKELKKERQGEPNLTMKNPENKN